MGDLTVTQIIGGSVILLTSVLIILLTLAQSKKTQDMGSALSGQSADDNFFSKSGKGSSREDALASLTKIMAIIFFAGTMLLNILLSFGF
jgi:protein translocase SecG subunit